MRRALSFRCTSPAVSAVSACLIRNEVRASSFQNTIEIRIKTSESAAASRGIESLLRDAAIPAVRMPAMTRKKLKTVMRCFA